MKKTFSEKLIWFAMVPTISEYLKSEFKELNIKEVIRISKNNYNSILERTPDIGSFKKNPLRICLSGGIVWIAVFNAMKELNFNMSNEQFGEMVIKTSNAPIIKKFCEMKKPFNNKFQKKKILKDKVSNEISSSSFNWKTETIQGRDADEYVINYHKCGLCALVKQENCKELLPYMCAMDYISIEQMGGVLTRTKTLARGDKLCNFYICKKNSKWDNKK